MFGGLLGYVVVFVVFGLGGLVLVVLKLQCLVLMVVFDGCCVGLQLVYSDGLGKWLGKVGVVWFVLWCMWVVEFGGVISQDKFDFDRQVVCLMIWFDGQVEGDYDEVGVYQVVCVVIVVIEVIYFMQLFDVQIFLLVEGGFVVLFQYDLLMVKVMWLFGGCFYKFVLVWEVWGVVLVIFVVIKVVVGVDEEFVFVYECLLVFEQLVVVLVFEVFIKVLGVVLLFGEVLIDEEGIDKGVGFFFVIVEFLGVIDVDEDVLVVEVMVVGLCDYQVVGV